jgi:hypothetical protein
VAGSIRQNAIGSLVATLQSITPANGYLNDFSGSGVVSLAQETVEARQEMNRAVVIRVRDGAEITDRRGAHDTVMQARLALVVEVIVRKVQNVAMVTTVNDVIGDIRLAVDKNVHLNQFVDDATVQQISEPSYDWTQQVAVFALTVVAIYDYMAGIES